MGRVIQVRGKIVKRQLRMGKGGRWHRQGRRTGPDGSARLGLCWESPRSAASAGWCVQSWRGRAGGAWTGRGCPAAAVVGTFPHASGIPYFLQREGRQRSLAAPPSPIVLIHQWNVNVPALAQRPRESALTNEVQLCLGPLFFHTGPTAVQPWVRQTPQGRRSSS